MICCSRTIWSAASLLGGATLRRGGFKRVELLGKSAALPRSRILMNRVLGRNFSQSTGSEAQLLFGLWNIVSG